MSYRSHAPGAGMTPLLFLLSAAAIGTGCGDDDGPAGEDGGAADAGSDATPDDCATVGCAPAPLCSEGCTERCGCCPCAVGSVMDIGGSPFECTAAGCYAPVVDGGTPDAAAPDAAPGDAATTCAAAGEPCGSPPGCCAGTTCCELGGTLRCWADPPAMCMPAS